MAFETKNLAIFKALNTYIPSELPCGKVVNENWQPGQRIECCKTVCSGKDNGSIEACHASRKKPDALAMYGNFWNNPNPKDRLFNH